MSDNNKRSDEIRLKEIQSMEESEKRLIEDLFSTKPSKEKSDKTKAKTLNTPKN